MDYINVPTTVFTPLEYGCVGYTEQDAKSKFGPTNIATYHIRFKAIEWAYNKERPENDFCYVKVLVNKTDNKKVVGFHLLAPNAGEITQGMAVAVKCGVTKELIDSCIGVYPSIGDDIVTLRYTKEENPDAKKGSC
jgi:thioredoxin reductase (NADPH)